MFTIMNLGCRSCLPGRRPASGAEFGKFPVARLFRRGVHSRRSAYICFRSSCSRFLLQDAGFESFSHGKARIKNRFRLDAMYICLYSADHTALFNGPMSATSRRHCLALVWVVLVSKNWSSRVKRRGVEFTLRPRWLALVQLVHVYDL